jgi:hypothetical protein
MRQEACRCLVSFFIFFKNGSTVRLLRKNRLQPYSRKGLNSHNYSSTVFRLFDLLNLIVEWSKKCRIDSLTVQTLDMTGFVGFF